MLIEVVMTGTLPLIVHSQRAMNPRDPLAQELKKISAKRNKTEEDLDLLSDLEFRLGLYLDAKERCCLPYLSAKKSIQDGAKKSKKGSLVCEALRPHPDSDMFPILVDGRTVTVSEILREPEFRDVRTVDVNGSVVTRTRPIFRDWKVKALFTLVSEVLDLDDLRGYAEDAGRRSGVGDYRVGRNGEYGLYDVVVRAL